jgi:hypothetical protein
MTKIRYLLIYLLVVFLLGACGNKPTPSAFISGIGSALPASWQMTVTDQESEIGHPHGLEEPLFRIDFLDSLHRFHDEGGRQYSPSARLYFYDIAQDSTVMAAIEREKFYS